MKRTCNKCRVEKSILDFPRDSHGKSGYGVRCKLCKYLSKHKLNDKIVTLAPKIVTNVPYKEQTYKRPSRAKPLIHSEGFKSRPVPKESQVFTFNEVQDLKKILSPAKPGYAKRDTMDSIRDPWIDRVEEPAKVTIHPEGVANVEKGGLQSNLFQSLSERFDATYTLTVRKDGKSTIQVHSQPSLHFKAQTPEALLEKIMC